MNGVSTCTCILSIVKQTLLFVGDVKVNTET